MISLLGKSQSFGEKPKGLQQERKETEIVSTHLDDKGSVILNIFRWSGGSLGHQGGSLVLVSEPHSCYQADFADYQLMVCAFGS